MPDNRLMPFWKTFGFWITVGLWICFMGGHYASIMPSPYGLLAANVVAVVYAIVRCLRKRAAGLSWKGMLYTSEFAVSGLTVLINLLESLAEIPSMPPKALTGISAGVAFMVAVLHGLGGKGRMALGIPVVSADDINTAIEGHRAEVRKPGGSDIAAMELESLKSGATTRKGSSS